MSDESTIAILERCLAEELQKNELYVAQVKDLQRANEGLARWVNSARSIAYWWMETWGKHPECKPDCNCDWCEGLNKLKSLTI